MMDKIIIFLNVQKYKKHTKIRQFNRLARTHSLQFSFKVVNMGKIFK